MLIWLRPFGSLWGLKTYMDTSLQEQARLVWSPSRARDHRHSYRPFLAQGDTINFNAGLRTHSVSMSVAEYLRVEGPTVCTLRA